MLHAVSRCGVRCGGCWTCLAPPSWLRRQRTCGGRCGLIVSKMVASADAHGVHGTPICTRLLTSGCATFAALADRKAGSAAHLMQLSRMHSSHMSAYVCSQLLVICRRNRSQCWKPSLQHCWRAAAAQPPALRLQASWRRRGRQLPPAEGCRINRNPTGRPDAKLIVVGRLT